MTVVFCFWVVKLREDIKRAAKRKKFWGVFCAVGKKSICMIERETFYKCRGKVTWGFSSLCMFMCVPECVHTYKDIGKNETAQAVCFCNEHFLSSQCVQYYLWVTLRSSNSTSGQVGAQLMSMGVLLISRMKKKLNRPFSNKIPYCRDILL